MEIVKLILVLLFLPSLCFAYTPPKGIPDPALSFGAFGEIDQAPPTTGSGGVRCTGWPNTTSEGCYYVDNSVSCNDTNCTNRGCPATPRCTLPNMSALAAGTYIEVHGGVGTPYTGSLVLAAAGTDSNPVWIVGIPDGGGNKPILDNYWNIPTAASGDAALDYTVITGFEMADGRVVVLRPRAGEGYIQTINHLILRDLDFSSTTTNISAITVGGTSDREGSYTKNIVVYDSIITDWGDPASAGEGCGIYTQQVTNAWYLDNYIENVEEDSFAGCHNCADEAHAPKNIFIGRNTIKNSGANSIDLKQVHGAIISENNITGPTPLYRYPNNGTGGAIYHKEADQTYSKDIWTIFNVAYNMPSPWYIEECTNCHFVGNICYDIDGPITGGVGADHAYRFAINASASGTNYVVDNTIYNSNHGINISYKADEPATVAINVTGNLISSRNYINGYEIYSSSTNAAIVIDRNMFMGGSADSASAFYWDGGAKTFAQFKTAECTNCKDYVADSLTIGFSDADANIFSLTSLSSAIGANTESGVYAYFEDIWLTETTGLCAVGGLTCTGLSIKKDYAGTARPQQTTWDIGAYEYDPNVATPQISGAVISGAVFK